MNGKVIPVRVALRTRPLISKETNEGSSECLKFVKEANQVIIGENKAFTYDYIFPPSTHQQEVYNLAVDPLIDGIFKGYNATVLAYGQTGSGKSYTMGSAHSVSKAGIIGESTGVIPRVIKKIFDETEKRTDLTFAVKVWYAEIYKEEVKDLLCEGSCAGQNLNIREYNDGSIKIQDITEIAVENPESTLQLMEAGNASRATGSTAMNKTSSRSHAIFTIIVEATSRDDTTDVTTSRFHLVDLAGSERIKRTKAEGQRLQEGIKINAGLLALGNVISALGESKPPSHIPYRDSKLTRLLQNSLGGNSMTVMIPVRVQLTPTLRRLSTRYGMQIALVRSRTRRSSIVTRSPLNLLD